jgi:plasmid replication initiation protein
MARDTSPKVLYSKTPKVYKHKKLNNANFGDFTLNDYQVYLHLITKIGGVDQVGKYLQPEQLQREYILSAKEFSEVFNVSLPNCYDILKHAVDKLMKTDIKVERVDLNEVWRINVCSTAKYNKSKGNITIKFTDDIMPYLAQVKEKFVLYNLKEISDFRSLYTTRLYELTQEFKETGWIRKSVEQLREIFAVGNSFKLYGDFKKYTFAHACAEINAKHGLDLTFKEIKEGRKVVALEFSFKKIKVHQVTDPRTGVSRNVYTKPKKSTDKNSGPFSNNDAKPLKDVIEGLVASYG